MPKKFIKPISLVLCFCFFFTQTGLAQLLPTQQGLSPQGTVPVVFQLPTLRYLSVNTANPSNYFNFLMDKGQRTEDGSQRTELNQEATKLIHYFFLGLTLPSESFWVNLKPQEPERITSEELSKTDLGRTLLEQDLKLKKDMANYLHPHNPQGKLYWEKLYQALEREGRKASATNRGGPAKNNGWKKATITSSSRVWIVPAEAVVLETEDGALVAKATLKVLLESEYLSLKEKRWNKEVEAKSEVRDEIKHISENLMKEIILPALTKEINESPGYAPLRQVYHSLILAEWYKRKNLKTEELKNGKTSPYASYINSGTTKGLESELPWEKQAIWQEYLKSYQEGEYKLQDTIFGLKRMYFSGGILLGLGSSPITILPKDTPEALKLGKGLRNNLIPLSIRNEKTGSNVFRSFIISLILAGTLTLSTSKEIGVEQSQKPQEQLTYIQTIHEKNKVPIPRGVKTMADETYRLSNTKHALDEALIEAKAIMKNSRFGKKKLGILYFNLARVLYYRGNYIQAYDYFNRAARLGINMKGNGYDENIDYIDRRIFPNDHLINENGSKVPAKSYDNREVINYTNSYDFGTDEYGKIHQATSFLRDLFMFIKDGDRNKQLRFPLDNTKINKFLKDFRVEELETRGVLKVYLGNKKVLSFSSQITMPSGQVFSSGGASISYETIEIGKGLGVYFTDMDEIDKRGEAELIFETPDGIFLIRRDASGTLNKNDDIFTIEEFNTSSPISQIKNKIAASLAVAKSASSAVSLDDRRIRESGFGDQGMGRTISSPFRGREFLGSIFWGSLLGVAGITGYVIADTYTPFVYTYKLPLSQQAAIVNDFMVDYLKGEDIALVGFSAEARLKLKAALKLFKEKDPDGYSKFKKDTFAIVLGDQKLYEAGLSDTKFSGVGGWYAPTYIGEHKWFMIKEETAKESSLTSLVSIFAHENMHQIQNRDKDPFSEFEAHLKGLLGCYKIDDIAGADWNVKQMAADFEEQAWRVETSDGAKILSRELAEIFNRQGISVENTFLESLIAKQVTDNISYRKMTFSGKWKDRAIGFLRKYTKTTLRAAIKFILAKNGFYSYSYYGKLQSILGIKKGISKLERKITGSDNYREKLRLLSELGKLRKTLTIRELDLAVTNELRGTFVPRAKPINKNAELLNESAGLPAVQTASSAVTHKRDEALIQIGEVITTIQRSKYQKGAIVDLRGLPADKEVILVGDLHARLDNLKKILNDNDNLGAIQRGEAVLVILGDAVHPEVSEDENKYFAELMRSGKRNEAEEFIRDILSKMDSSIEIMQLIMDLKIQNPDNIYYILGNHDYLSPVFSKGGVRQGIVYRKKLVDLYREEYIRHYEDFIKASPLMVIGNGFIGAHGGPVKGATLDEMKNVNVADEENPIVHQALWGRFGESYNAGDVQEFLENIGQPNAQFIVGHSPGKIKDGGWHGELMSNHHVIFAGHNRVGYAIVVDGKVDFIEASGASAKELEKKMGQEEISETTKNTPTRHFLGGERKGGQLETPFIGSVWIEAGSFVYKVWVENDKVNLQRYDAKKEKAMGKIHYFSLGQDYQVGRSSEYDNNYIMPDDTLSGKHFQIRITEIKGNIFKVMVKDLNSLNGTVFEYTKVQSASSAVGNPITENRVQRTDLTRETSITETGGIDLSQIELTLKDDKYISSLNPADIKILRAAKALKEEWNSLSLLYIHELILLLKDNLASDIQNKNLLSQVLRQLQSREFLDPQAIQFLNFIQANKPLSEVKLAIYQ